MGNIIQDILGLVIRKKPVAPKDKDLLVMARQKLKYQFNNIQDSPELDDQLTTVKQLSDYIVAKVPNELPNPGTEGQVLALDSNLDPIWKDDADTTSTIFQTSDVPDTLDYKGDVYIPTGTGVILSAGKVHYLASDGSNDKLVLVNSVTTASQMTTFVGIAFTEDDRQGVLIKGIINLGSSPGGNIGDPVYLTGSGLLSATSPSGAGEYVRVMGHYLGNNKVFFNPSQDFILLS
jgi:hypothetical protein